MKIFNWIFGAFFRTLGRFLFYIGIGLLVMFFISGKANAAVSPYFKDITFPATYKIYNLTSSNTRSEISTTKSCISNETDYFDICYVTWDATFATYGYGINILTDNTFLTGNNYGVTYYFGSNSWVWYSNWYSGYSNQSYISGGWWENSSNNILSEQRNDCIDLGSTYNDHVYGYRYLCSFNQVFKATNTGYYLWTVFNRSTTGSATEQDFSFLGYSISNQGASGLTVEEIKTSLASDFDALESSITSMKDTQEETNNKLDEQIQQDKEQHDETMDTITSTDGADLGALQNSAGWLPPGPLDSILNLPLSLLNNITSNLNKTCQPVILPIPLVNENLTLPCVNTLYDDMGISGWVTTIGVIASAFIMLSYLLKLYRWVDDMLSFRENNQIDNWGGI